MPDTARERLAALLADTCDQLVHRQADAILNALRLTDAAALALMEGEAVAMPRAMDTNMAGAAARAVLNAPSPEALPSLAYVRVAYDAALAASPYKDNSDDHAE